MIKNQIIIDKVNAKTHADAEMRGFLLDILNRESEGKQFKKYYTAEIQKISRRQNARRKGN